MTREEYMYQKIAELSPVNKDLSQKMVNHLGEWTTINEVAKYFKKHRNTIYDKVDNGDIFYRKLWNRDFNLHKKSDIFAGITMKYRE